MKTMLCEIIPPLVKPYRIRTFTKSSQIISTHLFTVLTMGVIIMSV